MTTFWAIVMILGGLGLEYLAEKALERHEDMEKLEHARRLHQIRLNRKLKQKLKAANQKRN